MDDEKKVVPINKGGRPRKNVDFVKLATICQYPLTNEDIATLMDLSVDTIDRECKRVYGLGFADYKTQKQASTRKTILAKQLEVAKAGNVTMLIWLGKQYLGQTEKQEIKAAVSAIRIDKVEENL